MTSVSLPPPGNLLPHRAIALVLDEITELVPGERGEGVWKPDERYFEGHFPDNPVLPGHWTTECVNLIAGSVILAAHPNRLLLYREGAQKFTGIVSPGDTLTVSAIVTSIREERGRLIAEASGAATVDGKAVFRASVIKIVGQPPS